MAGNVVQGADGVAHFGLGVGTLVLMLNCVFPRPATRSGAHSLRHLIGRVFGYAIKSAGVRDKATRA